MASTSVNTTQNDINVLLLGETGVGKSTFINSFANYLTYKSFEEVLENKMHILIPSQMTLTNNKKEQVNITVGDVKDKNECLKIGASATQSIKTYVFPIKYKNQTIKLRLIDTPGMADCRGIEQDDKNCENILDYLTTINELHAICFLLKSGQSKITVAFEYCVKQILSRLEKSASGNLIFIFTHTRGTNYDAGETFPCLKKIVESIKQRPPHVKIPLKDNIFYFDNEGFRYLAGVKHGIQFNEYAKISSTSSWMISTKEVWRLLFYIIENRMRQPHQLLKTISINQARKLIFQLSNALAEITQLINDNLYVLEKRRNELNVENQSIDELKKKLYIPVTNIRVETLENPVTVCTSSKCAEVYQVEGVKKWHYSKRCHDPCTLTDVQKELIGDPALLRCKAMNGTRTCIECECDYSTHMHINYHTTTFDDKVIDKKMFENIKTEKDAVKCKKNIIDDIEKKITELEEESAYITETLAKFAFFLQNNAITPFNDSYKSYVEYSITRERGLGVNADRSVIKRLQKLLQQYEERKKAFEENLDSTGTLKNNPSGAALDAQSILNSIKKLYALKHTGKKIKELMESEKSSRRNDNATHQEYVHPIMIDAPVKQLESDIENDEGGESFDDETLQKEDYSHKKSHYTFKFCTIAFFLYATFIDQRVPRFKLAPLNLLIFLGIYLFASISPLTILGLRTVFNYTSVKSSNPLVGEFSIITHIM